MVTPRPLLFNEPVVQGPSFTALGASLASPFLPASAVITVEFLLVTGDVARVKVMSIKNADKLGTLFLVEGVRMDGGLVTITDYNIMTCNIGSYSDRANTTVTTEIRAFTNGAK